MARFRGVRFGIVGTGVVAELHVRAIRDMRGGRLVGLCLRQGGDKAQTLAQLRRCGENHQPAIDKDAAAPRFSSCLSQRS